MERHYEALKRKELTSFVFSFSLAHSLSVSSDSTPSSFKTIDSNGNSSSPRTSVLRALPHALCGIAELSINYSTL